MQSQSDGEGALFIRDMAKRYDYDSLYDLAELIRSETERSYIFLQDDEKGQTDDDDTTSEVRQLLTLDGFTSELLKFSESRNGRTEIACYEALQEAFVRFPEVRCYNFELVTMAVRRYSTTGVFVAPFNNPSVVNKLYNDHIKGWRYPAAQERFIDAVSKAFDHIDKVCPLHGGQELEAGAQTQMNEFLQIFEQPDIVYDVRSMSQGRRNEADKRWRELSEKNLHVFQRLLKRRPALGQVPRKDFEVVHYAVYDFFQTGVFFLDLSPELIDRYYQQTSRNSRELFIKVLASALDFIDQVVKDPEVDGYDKQIIDNVDAFFGLFERTSLIRQLVPLSKGNGAYAEDVKLVLDRIFQYRERLDPSPARKWMIQLRNRATLRDAIISTPTYSRPPEPDGTGVGNDEPRPG